MQWTRFTDEESCRDTAQARRVDMDATWRVQASDCLPANKAGADAKKMFAGEVLKFPYLTFLEEGNLRNVVYFQSVPPVALDVMVWKWYEGLCQQGLIDVRVVMDPGRQRMKNLIDEAKEKVTGKTAAKASSPRPSASAPSKPKKNFTKMERLILHNGQMLEGQTLRTQSGGIWFRMDEGVDMYVADSEIKSREPIAA